MFGAYAEYGPAPFDFFSFPGPCFFSDVTCAKGVKPFWMLDVGCWMLKNSTQHTKSTWSDGDGNMGTKAGIARALARAPGFRGSYILHRQNPCHRGLVDTLSGFNDAPSHPSKADSSMLSCQMALDMMPISQADMTP